MSLLIDTPRPPSSDGRLPRSPARLPTAFQSGWYWSEYSLNSVTTSCGIPVWLLRVRDSSLAVGGWQKRNGLAVDKGLCFPSTSWMWSRSTWRASWPWMKTSLRSSSRVWVKTGGRCTLPVSRGLWQRERVGEVEGERRGRAVEGTWYMVYSRLKASAWDGGMEAGAEERRPRSTTFTC